MNCGSTSRSCGLVRLTSNSWLRTRETLGHTYSTDVTEATLASSYPQNLKCSCRITSISRVRRMPQSGATDAGVHDRASSPMAQTPILPPINWLWHQARFNYCRVSNPGEQTTCTPHTGLYSTSSIPTGRAREAQYYVSTR